MKRITAPLQALALLLPLVLGACQTTGDGSLVSVGERAQSVGKHLAFSTVGYAAIVSELARDRTATDTRDLDVTIARLKSLRASLEVVVKRVGAQDDDWPTIDNYLAARAVERALVPLVGARVPALSGAFSGGLPSFRFLLGLGNGGLIFGTMGHDVAVMAAKIDAGTRTEADAIKSALRRFDDNLAAMERHAAVLTSAIPEAQK